MATSIRDISVTGLTNAHAQENQAVPLLSRLAARLEQILERLGTSHPSIKDAMTGWMGNVAALGNAQAPDEVVRTSFAFEHDDIATDQALLEMADAAADAEAPSLLRQSLDEKQRMALGIDQHLPETIRTFMRLESAGQTSGV